MSLAARLTDLAPRIATEVKGKLAAVRTIAASEQLVTWTIADDGSPTAGWPNRLSVIFDPQSGADVEVFALNEYGEPRVTPAKANTVGFRLFSGLNSTAYTARDKSVPLIEVMDDRTTRTHKVGIYPDGDADFAKDVAGGGDLTTAGLLLGGRRITAGPTPPASPAPGDIHILTED